MLVSLADIEQDIHYFNVLGFHHNGAEVNVSQIHELCCFQVRRSYTFIVLTICLALF